VDDEDAYQDWLNRYENVLWDDQRTHGAVCLCHEGCAYRDWLIITGPRRGQMWDDERAGDVDLAASTANDGSTLTFGRWYLNWLNEAERTVFKTAADPSCRQCLPSWLVPPDSCQGSPRTCFTGCPGNMGGLAGPVGLDAAVQLG